ncbi:MAG: sulfurtransferase TusA family protein [Planctomycetaceae bacterium]
MQSADAVCDGGDLDCGSGLLLIIRKAMEPLEGGGVLEVRSRELSVREDLPAWCRMVGHTILASVPGAGGSTSYFLRKKDEDRTLRDDLEEARRFPWKARVRWTEGMQARAYVRNHTFAVGQPASFDTADPAPGGVEYLLGALGGALVVGFQWRASRRGVTVRHLEISLQARADNILVFLGLEETGHPGLAAVQGKLFLDADGDAALVDELWRETVAGCPVAQTLLRGTPLAIEARRA